MDTIPSSSMNDHADRAKKLARDSYFKCQISSITHIKRLYEKHATEYIDSVIANVFIFLSENNNLTQLQYFGLLNKLKTTSTLKILKIFEYLYYAKSNSNDCVKLVMAFSSIESIMSKHEFVDFFNWILSKKAKQEMKQLCQNSKSDSMLSKCITLITSLKDKYADEYGQKRKFVSFMKAYIPEPEKLEIINCFKLKDDTTDNDEEKFKKIYDYLYEQRNNFVHNVCLCDLPLDEAAFLWHNNFHGKEADIYLKARRFLDIIISSMYNAISAEYLS